MTLFNFGQITIIAAVLSVSIVGASPDDRVFLAATPERGEAPDAEIGPDGTIHLAYVKGENAFYVRSEDGGKTFSAPLRINSEENTVHPSNMFRGPDLAVGKNGRVHVILYGNGYQRKLPPQDWGVFYSHFDSGTKSFSKTVNLNHKPSDNFSLAADRNGNVAVVWMAGKLFLSSSADNGETFAAPELVPNADPCECCASRALFARDGTLVIDYREKANNVRDMHLLLRGQGQTLFIKRKLSGIPWQVNGCPMTGTYLTSAGSRLIAAWETKGQIFFSRNASNGSEPVQEVKVAERGKWPVALAAGDGTLLVSWKNGYTLYWQLFDKTDAPLGEVHSTPGSNPNRHSGVVNAKGEFILMN